MMDRYHYMAAVKAACGDVAPRRVARAHEAQSATEIAFRVGHADNMDASSVAVAVRAAREAAGHALLKALQSPPGGGSLWRSYADDMARVSGEIDALGGVIEPDYEPVFKLLDRWLRLEK